MSQDPDWLADLARVGSGGSVFREQSLWAIWVYRFGRRIDQRASGIQKKIMNRIYWLMFRIIETLTGISIPKSCEIGPGLRIWHFGGIFIHPNTRIGANCTLRQGVTIGNRWDNDEAPLIGDGVEVGASAQILGAVTIGSGARIGALTLVLKDVPEASTAVGIPARILSPNVIDGSRRNCG